MRGVKVKIHEERYEHPVDIKRKTEIILTQEEYEELKTAFCKGKGWNLDYPHTVNVQSLTLTGNYKWMPRTEVKFHIEIVG